MNGNGHGSSPALAGDALAVVEDRKKPQFAPTPAQRRYLVVLLEATGKGLEATDVALALKVPSPKRHDSEATLRPEAISRWRRQPGFNEWLAAAFDDCVRRIKPMARYRHAMLALRGSTDHYKTVFGPTEGTLGPGGQTLTNHGIIVHVHE